MQSNIFDPMFKAMPQGEIDSHLGYESNDPDPKSIKTAAMNTAVKH